MKPGQRSYIPGAGYIRVESVDEVALDELTDDDAHLDGFESAPALRAEIEQLYPKELAIGTAPFEFASASCRRKCNRKCAKQSDWQKSTNESQMFDHSAKLGNFFHFFGPEPDTAGVGVANLNFFAFPTSSC